MTTLKLLLYFFIAPGFLFAAAVGLASTWIDRKLSARLQWRKGPPWFQPAADIFKLLGKETLLPEGAVAAVLLGAPLAGLAAVTLVATMLGRINFSRETIFIGDIIVIVYLLAIPSLAIIIGGLASRNPLAALGASREMKLILAYELPFILALFTVVYKTGSIILGEIINYQSLHGMMVQNLSGLAAFIAALLVIQAKLGAVPFDIPEADQELAAGPLIEYSGPPLAVFRLVKAMLTFILPVLLVSLFMGGLNPISWAGGIWLAVKYFIVLLLIILIKNTNPRIRIDQAIRFFWGPVTLLAAAGFILALLGW